MANTEGVGLNLRALPSTSARIAAVLPEGTVLEVIGEDRTTEGRTWKNVRAAAYGSGWVAAEYTAAVAAAAPPPETAPAPATRTPSDARATTAPAASSAPSSTVAASAAPSPATASGSPLLAVEVVPAAAELGGGPQTVDVAVTRDGGPVASARVTIEIRYADGSSESQDAPPMDQQGLTEVSWTPGGPPGQVGIGVVATAPDGTTGAGSASFRMR